LFFCFFCFFLYLLFSFPHSKFIHLSPNGQFHVNEHRYFSNPATHCHQKPVHCHLNPNTKSPDQPMEKLRGFLFFTKRHIATVTHTWQRGKRIFERVTIRYIVKRVTALNSYTGHCYLLWSLFYLL